MDQRRRTPRRAPLIAAAVAHLGLLWVLEWARDPVQPRAPSPPAPVMEFTLVTLPEPAPEPEPEPATKAPHNAVRIFPGSITSPARRQSHPPSSPEPIPRITAPSGPPPSGSKERLSMRGFSVRKRILAPHEITGSLLPHSATPQDLGETGSTDVSSLPKKFFVSKPETPKSPFLDKNGTPYKALDRPGYVANLSSDGRVTFSDKRSIGDGVGFKLPCAKCIANSMQGWVDDPRSGGGFNPLEFLPFTLGGSFELNDLVLRAIGNDPYLADKIRYMRATEPHRRKLEAEFDKAALKDSVRNLRGFLKVVWDRSQLTRVQRRRLLFQLWDEARTSGTDAERAAGRHARATVLGFIRRRLPKSHRHAYSSAELETLNRRRKVKEAFAPYAASPQ